MTAEGCTVAIVHVTDWRTLGVGASGTTAAIASFTDWETVGTPDVVVSSATGVDLTFGLVLVALSAVAVGVSLLPSLIRHGWLIAAAVGMVVAASLGLNRVAKPSVDDTLAVPGDVVIVAPQNGLWAAIVAAALALAFATLLTVHTRNRDRAALRA